MKHKKTVYNMKHGGAVYIMTNKRNGILYVGVTNDLRRRIFEHRTHVDPGGFTAKYGCNTLVYYCGFHSIEDAIAEEKRLKGGNRKAKLALIESINPQWEDLWEEIKEW
jgi:putative endonuclease